MMINTSLQKTTKRRENKSQNKFKQRSLTSLIRSKYRRKIKDRSKGIRTRELRLVIKNLSKNQELQSLMGRNVSLRSVLLSVIVIVLLSRLEKNVLKSPRPQKLHSFLKSCVLDADSVLRNVLSKQLTLSTYPQDLKVRSLIDMETISSRFIDFLLQNQEKYSD